MAFVNNIYFILISWIIVISLVSSSPLKNVVRVPFCPVDKESWMAASERLNCEKYNRNYKYHCTINPYLNSTFETCNIKKEIVGYKCTEYNQRGQVIQESDLSCRYQEQPCPERYYSTESYKYQGCYMEVYRKIKICPEKNSVSSDIPSDISSIGQTTVKKCISEEKEDSVCVFTIPCIAFFVISLIVNICLCIWIFRRRFPFVCNNISKAGKGYKEVSLKTLSIVEKVNDIDKVRHTLQKKEQRLVNEPNSILNSNCINQNFGIPAKLAVYVRSLESDIDLIIWSLKENDCNNQDLKKYVFMMKEKLQMMQGKTNTHDGLHLDRVQALAEIISSSSGPEDEGQYAEEDKTNQVHEKKDIRKRKKKPKQVSKCVNKRPGKKE